VQFNAANKKTQKWGHKNELVQDLFSKIIFESLLNSKKLIPYQAKVFFKS